MALSPHALQRKREKKKNNRSGKTSSLSLPQSLPARQGALYESRLSQTLWEKGMGYVLVARQSPVQEIVVGVYLLDVFCLGVKNCFVHTTDKQGYVDLLTQLTARGETLIAIEPRYAHTLIQQAITFAKQCGFKPHRDFMTAQSLLRNIPLDPTLLFHFGKEGKPYYLPGPYESPATIKRILYRLASTQGAGHYHYLIPTTDDLEP